MFNAEVRKSVSFYIFFSATLIKGYFNFAEYMYILAISAQNSIF